MGVSEEKLNKFYMYLEKIGIKLFPYQKKLIKETLERSNAYVIYPPNVGKRFSNVGENGMSGKIFSVMSKKRE